MKYLAFLLFAASLNASAQNSITSGKDLKKNLKSHVSYLADDKLEGRRTGTAGEKLAYEYIISQFKKAGLAPAGTANNYLQPFDVHEGRELSATNSFTINGKMLKINDDYFPLAFSGNGKVDASNSSAFHIIDLGQLLEQNKTNPHYDLYSAIQDSAGMAATSGAKAVIIVNSSSIKDDIKFFDKERSRSVSVPVVYVKDATAIKNISSASLKAEVVNKTKKGHNVAGFIDNKAPFTVVLGAHYDHLGYGEDHNSLYSGKEKMIHNGADDNASGTAALIELASLLKRSGSKQNNYLFVAFSGEELGLYGSKYFVENSIVPVEKMNYMINMDMLGRLNEQSHGLTIGGYGTSPVWFETVSTKDDYLNIKIDSSGSGPSDHTSFYRKDVPVLFFFTGTHQDYHKPSDDTEKINFDGQEKIVNYIYNVITSADSKGKLAFQKTKEPVVARSTFRVSLGIMPDYTYSGNGVLAEGVTEGRAAQKAGIKAGDVVTQIGDHKFSEIQGYMQALSKFNKGDEVKVKVMRGTEELEFTIVF